MSARVILHIDMDAFYASVEQRDRPELRGKPVLVGGSSPRGVLATASYEARRFGCRSAMPTVQAMRLCPQAIMLTPRMGRYKEVSDSVFAIFHRYTPLVEALSLDEAFLDVSGSQSLFGSGVEIATRIRAEIQHELGLTASAGVASSKFVAKIASDLHKPNGLSAAPIGDAEVLRAFLAPLPIEKMWGIGPKGVVLAKRFGFYTFADVARASEDERRFAFSNDRARILALSQGNDERSVEPGREAKSVGAEQTFETDLHVRSDIERTLLAHSVRVAERLTENAMAGRTVTVKLKYQDFSIETRTMSVAEGVSDTDSIFRCARALLSKFSLSGRKIRLSGVSVSGFDNLSRELFPSASKVRGEMLERLALQIRAKTGANVTRAALVDTRERRGGST